MLSHLAACCNVSVMRGAFTALLLALLVGCGGGSNAPVDTTLAGGRHLRAAVRPDVLLISVSGRAFELDFFCPPDCNQPYLGDPGDAAETVMLELVNHGWLVERLDYAAALLNYDDDQDGEFDDRFGFLQLIADLEWVQQNWITGQPDPTQIVILAHSHGCVWAHIACSVLPQVEVDVLVSLDGVCLQWAPDNEDSFDSFYAAFGNPFPWDISMPCDRWNIPGLADPEDTEDVVEVRSNGGFPTLIRDEQTNHRLDGTSDGIATFDSVNDDHSGVHSPTGESIAWVLARLADLGY
jgi:hypothetical protein